MASTTMKLSPTRRLLMHVLERYGSRHIKRIIFFGSLFPYALQLESLKSDVMNKLNRHMGLAATGRALLIPGIIRNLVWGDRGLDDTISPQDIRDDITDERADKIAWTIVKKTPPCLIYDTLERIHHDVKDMFLYGHDLAPAC